MTPRDLEHIAEETEHVVGLPESLGGSGDTSVMTGLGVYLGMKAAAKAAWGDDDLSGRTVAFQGFGNVGSNTAKHLIEEGAKIVATDLYEGARRRAADTGATVVGLDDIYDVECDIFSPCALGGVLNGDTVPRLRCSIVAGGANNQLLSDADGDLLEERGITYAPDYVINAGGIINVGCEVGGVYRKDRALELTKRIYQTTLDVIETARAEGHPHLRGGGPYRGTPHRRRSRRQGDVVVPRQHGLGITIHPHPGPLPRKGEGILGAQFCSAGST